MQGATHWSDYLSPAEAPYGRGGEQYFRLTQLVRKRTMIDPGEVSQIVRRSPSTITRKFAVLRSKGILEEVRGRYHRLAAQAAWAVGVVVESHRVVALGFSMAYDLAQDEFGPSEPVVREVDLDRDPAGVLDAAAEAVADVMAEGWQGDLLGVGLALPMPVDNKGVCRTQIARAWHGLKPAEELQERLAAAGTGQPVIVSIDNDASLGALGVFLNRHRQADRPADAPTDLAYVRLADGVGLGLVLKGKFVRGGHGLAGELAHRPVDAPRAAKCPRCGRRCLESVSTVWAIEARLRARSPITFEPPMRQVLTGYRHLEPTDRAALLHEVRMAGLALGEALAPVVAAIDPQIVVIGGPLAASLPGDHGGRDDLRDTLRAAVDRGLLGHGFPFLEEDRDVQPRVEMTKARVALPRPELRGAAAMVVQRHADAWLWWKLEQVGLVKA